MEDKNVLVKLPEESEEQKKKKERRIFALFAMGLMVVSDIAGLLAYLSIKYNHKEDEYHPSEESKTIYSNLLSFIQNACSTDHPRPTELVAINYQDNQLLISSKNEMNEIYVTYNCEGGIETALTAFQNSVPSLEGYSVESAFTITDEKQLNITTYVENNNYVGLVSKSISNQYYVSSTYLCTCGSLISIVHQPYDEGGNYPVKLMASKEEKLVYDLLYVITYGVEQ
ncbi:MAG: hypothetical protein J5511_02635 [Bacilli bacterium]|nr:hypothetical protein [Bacilli bacterium]